MILIREIQEKDLGALERFAQIPGMFNLPADPDLLKERITKSRASFARKHKDLSETKYTFVAEDLKTGQVLATSMIAGQHGTTESPHFYFQVGNEKLFAESLNTGFIHGTLEFDMDMDGPSEIGALVVDPDCRNSPERVGRQISFARFLYVATHRDRFRPQIIAELLPPLNKRGLSPLWEAIGRRFTNMDYWEADQLAAKNKEFILSLFPSGKIYTTFLPAEARNAIGKVGKDTQPVKHMLEKIGFKYRNQVDPFDGGPHLWADTDQIKPIKNTAKLKWEGAGASQDGVQAGLLCAAREKAGEFRAVSVDAFASDKGLAVPDATRAMEASKVLGLAVGDDVYFMPYY